MSGYTSKKLITERHADPVTMDHIIELRKENERLRQHLRYQEHRDGRIGTHSHDCYGYGPSHYECALREIERLRSDEKKYQAIISKLLAKKVADEYWLKILQDDDFDPWAALKENQ